MKKDRCRKMTAALVMLVLLIVALSWALSPIPVMSLSTHAEHAAAMPVSWHDTCFFLNGTYSQ